MQFIMLTNILQPVNQISQTPNQNIGYIQ